MSRDRNNATLLAFPRTTGPPDCNRFNSCNAPLCPLDPELDRHFWYVDEPICRSTKYGQSQHRWIKKQVSIRKRKTKSWLEKSVTYAMLYKASRPKNLSEKERQRRSERIRRFWATTKDQLASSG